jgi:hypothetical protein
MVQIIFDRNASFPADFADSQGYSGVTATGETVLDVHKNGALVGTITPSTTAATTRRSLSRAAHRSS